MNIFVTGGTGFIGSYVVNELVKNGHFVTLLARNPDKVSGFKDNKSIKFIKGTISDHDIIENSLDGNEACIHISLCWGDTALSMLEQDTKNSVNLFEACIRHNIEHIIYTSSTAAVGELRKNMDKDTSTRPVDSYGATKAATEAYLLALSHTNGIKCSIIRPGYTFGNPVVDGGYMEPDERFHEIVFNALKNIDIHLIKNDGTQFIWAGHLAKLYHDILSSGENRRVFYGLGPEFITWEFITSSAIEYTGSKSKIILEDKGWEKGVFLFDSADITNSCGADLKTEDELVKHVNFIADHYETYAERRRGFESNIGTIKKKKDMKGKICLRPFMNLDILWTNDIRTCSSSWMPARIGDFSKNSLKEIWNSDMAQNLRKSIFDGTFEYCDWHQCPYYCNASRYLYDFDNLDVKELADYEPWIHSIKKRKIKMDLMPVNYNLAYDESCNLKCPSCRTVIKTFNRGVLYEQRLSIHNRFISELKEGGFNNITMLNITGSGEPFASKIYCDFLFNFDGGSYPNLRIDIQSNGILFTPKVWEKMSKIHKNINRVLISLDASCQETYKKIRVNGDYTVLMKNLEFIAELKKENKIRTFDLAFVIQRKNYKEMSDAVKISKKLGADSIIFNLITNWLTWSLNEYDSNAVWKDFNPEFDEFSDILKDPVFDDKIVDLGNAVEYRSIR
jgi:UDP-glucose 4-epimerase